MIEAGTYLQSSQDREIERGRRFVRLLGLASSMKSVYSQINQQELPVQADMAEYLSYTQDLITWGLISTLRAIAKEGSPEEQEIAKMGVTDIPTILIPERETYIGRFITWNEKYDHNTRR